MGECKDMEDGSDEKKACFDECGGGKRKRRGRGRCEECKDKEGDEKKQCVKDCKDAMKDDENDDRNLRREGGKKKRGGRKERGDGKKKGRGRGCEQCKDLEGDEKKECVRDCKDERKECVAECKDMEDGSDEKKACFDECGGGK